MIITTDEDYPNYRHTLPLIECNMRSVHLKQITAQPIWMDHWPMSTAVRFHTWQIIVSIGQVGMNRNKTYTGSKHISYSTNCEAGQTKDANVKDGRTSSEFNNDHVKPRSSTIALLIIKMRYNFIAYNCNEAINLVSIHSAFQWKMQNIANTSTRDMGKT
jgi:hypothetical protein